MKENKRAGKKILCLICGAVFLFCLFFSSCSFGISLNRTEAVIEMAESFTLVATVSEGESVVWKSNDEDVVTVKDGRVLGVGEGTATVTATCGLAKATCKVTVTEATMPVSDVGELEMVWRDEFSGNALDLNKWGYQTGVHDVYHGKENHTLYWGNNELQYYTEEAVSVSDGNLVITAKKQEYEDMEYTSARILTRDLASFTYGYFEAKMKLPATEGMWPAFWMLPQPTDYSADKNVYGTWAANGEIDIMEARGRLPYEMGTALHFGGNYPNNTYKNETVALESSIEEWHTYGIDWREDKITWYVDGEAVFTLTSDDWWTSASDGESAPFDQPFYILLNLAVGGNYDGGRKPPEDFTSASMYVDYVRVYSHK